MAGLLDSVGLVEVTKDEIMDLLAVMNDLPERNFYAGLGCVVEFFEGNPEKVMATYFRMMALGRMIESDELRAWLLPITQEGCSFVNEHLLAAAFADPLIVEEPHCRFDTEALVARALAFAEVEGSA